MSDVIADLPVQSRDPSADFPERTLARLLITLYYSGQPNSTLLEGETRLIESKRTLITFDFWMREPGHLGLALLDCYRINSDQFSPVQRDSLQTLIPRLLTDDNADRHRVMATASYAVFSDLDHWLGHLTAAALVSDRPRFTRSRQAKITPQLILEPDGIQFTQKLLDQAPSLGWYRDQGETINACWNILAPLDLHAMSYLRPETTPTLASLQPLSPIIFKRSAILNL